MFSPDGFHYADDTSFLEEGIIDSLGVMELVGFVQQEFGFLVDQDEVLPENFGSVALLTDYVRRKRGTAVADESFGRVAGTTAIDLRPQTLNTRFRGVDLRVHQPNRQRSLEKSLLKRCLNRVLHLIVRVSPGSTTLRPILHRARGVKIGRGVFIGDDVYIDGEYPELIEIQDGAAISMRADHHCPQQGAGPRDHRKRSVHRPASDRDGERRQGGEDRRPAQSSAPVA